MLVVNNLQALNGPISPKFMRNIQALNGPISPTFLSNKSWCSKNLHTFKASLQIFQDLVKPMVTFLECTIYFQNCADWLVKLPLAVADISLTLTHCCSFERLYKLLSDKHKLLMDSTHLFYQFYKWFLQSWYYF